MLKEDIQYKQFVWELSNLIKDENDINRNIIFLCIGTSRVVGDSVGPIVGSILKQNIISNKQIEVLGDCENNIHYENIEQNVDIVKKLNPNSLIVVIDSALSKEENIGRIFVQNRGLKYGEGIKKKSNIVGNIRGNIILINKYNII